MKIASISLLKLTRIVGLISLAFVTTNSLAQSPQSNIVNVASPDVCASACGRDNMCASWTFRPNPSINGQPAGGQCQFTKPNQSSSAGSANFVQPRAISNVPNWTQSNIPTWTAPSRGGGNYSVTPLPTYSAPQARVAAAQSPANATTINRNHVSPTYQSSNMANNGAITQPAPQTERQLDWRPVETTPAQATALPNPNLNAYRTSDGTVDSAQMRREQLAAQNKTGQPRYSVQGEWSGVAQSVASGQNQSGIDWANTTPIPQAQEPNQRMQSAETTTASANYRGPLRARKQQLAQAQSSEELSEPKKGFFQNLGSMFGGGGQTREDRQNENANQESERVTAMHGPLRKRSPASQE